MFPARYFPVRAFATRYFPKVGTDAVTTGPRRKPQRQTKKTISLPAKVTLWPLVIEDRLCRVAVESEQNPLPASKPKRAKKERQTATVNLSPLIQSETRRYFPVSVACSSNVVAPACIVVEDITEIKRRAFALGRENMQALALIAMLRDELELVRLGVLDPMIV